MAELAEEARDLLLTSGSPWSSFRARGREWRDTALASEAWHAQLERKRAEGQSFSVISSRATSLRPDEIDEQWRIWIAALQTSDVCRGAIRGGRGVSSLHLV
jgi:hypothetical protein